MFPQNCKKIIGKIKAGGKEFPLVSVEIINNPALPFILLSAGIHGNEAAGVRALTEFLEEFADAYTARFNFIVFPCMNPVGRVRNTRENGNGADLNRNFSSEKPEEEVRAIKTYLTALNKKFLVAIDLHEDHTDAVVKGFNPKDNPRGMYLYEVSDAGERNGDEILSNLRAAGYPVAENKIIYGEAAEDGLIWMPPSHDPLRAGSFTDKYLIDYTNHTFVIETPTCWPVDERIAAHKKALALVLNAMNTL